MKRLNNEMLQFVRQVLRLQKSAALNSMPLAKGGSSRSFHRIRYGDHVSVVFMVYDRVREENNYYAAIAGFLLKIHVPVPRILAHDRLKGFILMEDLGDRDLWSYRSEPWIRRNAYYRTNLSIAHRLHAFPVQNFPSREVPLMEAFDADLYRWERDYFLENFARAVCGLKLTRADETALADELKGLSGRLEGAEPALVHRDLQSQNVMMCRDQPVFIDFQGMRFGTLFYDLGSLLYDPYVSFTEDERMELLRYYYGLPAFDRTDKLQDDKPSGNQDLKSSQIRSTVQQIGWLDFQDRFRDASAQRLMQALGAYGFLGLKSGHPEFLAHIPTGIANLVDCTSRAGQLPLLKDLALKCQHSLANKSL